MNQRRAIVIVVDGLRASALGACGNTWHGTPALDAFASRSVVVETMWAETLDVADFYRAAWREGAFSREVGAAGGELTFLTDDAALATWADATPGVETWLLETPEPSGPAADVNETAVARLFAAAAECLQAWDSTPSAGPRVLWIHARGYRGPWDAPLELRASLLEEGDPEAPAFLHPPAVAPCDDHDALLAYRVAYAAQTMVLDECVGGLLAAAEAGGEIDQVVVLAGPRGFALGEHGVVGGECLQLYGEMLHLPCVVYTSGGAPAPPRQRGLATPTDLGVTLRAWLRGAGTEGPSAGVDLRDVCSPGRRYVTSRGLAGERSLRTDAWFLRKPAPAPSDSDAVDPELFVKPDDRWEANDVADRCHENVEELLALLDQAGTAPHEASFSADLAIEQSSGSAPGTAS